MKVFIIFLTVALLIGGCSTQPEYVDLQNSKEYSSMGLDYHDLEVAASQSVNSLLNSAYVQNLSGKPKVLAISDVKNDTMQRINTEQLTRKVVRDMRNSGKFILTMAIAGSGGTTDRMISRSRSLRDNEEFDAYSVAEKGTLQAPSLSLSGEIVQRNTKVGSKQRVDYYFLLTLTDIHKGIVLWDDEVNIIKVGSNASVSW
ncbi:penicillin-binding protein activator LpoB [Helicobacter monodelphidis]|uniref:penicillin-binding protein activator LpoB n=1 Tax=Helicobacter sp. 15-1451 TaxID=2004995 RepID=UPI000DCF197E|nr:penicillin-binding protein activator LpoB [Helicobacter sp. 15-1451]RAX58953.1 penicillin-binding protein activator LpoB [Helicobacter sp. 15-1451]